MDMDDEDCPCTDCGDDCDVWERQYCCILCEWLNGGQPGYCEGCDPTEI